MFALIMFGFLFFVLRQLSDIFNVWRTFFGYLSIEEFYSPVIALILTTLLTYAIGRFLLTGVFRWLSEHSKLANKVFALIRVQEYSEDVLRKDYYWVLYEEFEPGCNHYQSGCYRLQSPKLGLAIGVTTLKYPGGIRQEMVQIQKAPPRVADFLYRPIDKVYKLKYGFEGISTVFLSGGYDSLDVISLANFTDKLEPLSEEDIEKLKDK